MLLHDELQFSGAPIRSLIYNLCARISPTTCNYMYQLFGGPADSDYVSVARRSTPTNYTGPGHRPRQPTLQKTGQVD